MAERERDRARSRLYSLWILSNVSTLYKRHLARLFYLYFFVFPFFFPSNSTPPTTSLSVSLCLFPKPSKTTPLHLHFTSNEVKERKLIPPLNCFYCYCYHYYVIPKSVSVLSLNQLRDIWGLSDSHFSLVMPEFSLLHTHTILFFWFLQLKVGIFLAF